jgi:hypothetical protein
VSTSSHRASLSRRYRRRCSDRICSRRPKPTSTRTQNTAGTQQQRQKHTNRPESPPTKRHCSDGQTPVRQTPDTSDDAVPAEPPTSSTFQTTTVSNGTASGGKPAADKNQPRQRRAFTPRLKKQPENSVPAFPAVLSAASQPVPRKAGRSRETSSLNHRETSILLAFLRQFVSDLLYFAAERPMCECAGHGRPPE